MSTAATTPRLALRRGRRFTAASVSPRGSYPRVNSLNLIRLVLASLVIVDHARVVGGFGTDPMVGKVSLGALAVFSFFGISGFLIAASGLSSSPRQFLVNRVLRIFPAFWTCLILTAFVFAPLAVLGHRSSYSLLDGLGYVIRNIGLRDFQPSIGTTLATAPDPDMWNASLWTLPIEFSCYVAILVAGMIGLLRKRWPVFVATALVGLALVPDVSLTQAAGQHLGLRTQILELLVMFGVGASVRLWGLSFRPQHWSLALVCAVLVAAGFHWLAHPVPLIALPMVYVLLWVGAHLPTPDLLRRHDISYGIYIYGMPLQQLLTAHGANGHPELTYVLLSFAAVTPVAVVSWLLIERPALALKSARWLGGRTTAPIARPPDAPRHSRTERPKDPSAAYIDVSAGGGTVGRP